MSEPLAVVPIFVNAGAAILPAILASLVSALALLLKPKELYRLVRARPGKAAAVVCGLALLGLGGHWVYGLATASPVKPVQSVNWNDVAIQILNEQQTSAVSTTTAPRKLARWRLGAEVGGGWILAGPAVSGARVFAASALQDITGNLGVLFAADAESPSPKVLWKLEKNGEEYLKPFFSSPAVSEDGKSILIGQGLHVDTDCDLLCVDAASGRIRWAVRSALHIESSPAVHGDMVVVGCGAVEGPDHKPTGHGGYVLAVRISDGKELWRCDVADPESSPAIAGDGTVYVGSGLNGNAIVAIKDGKRVWKKDTPYPMVGPVVLAGELVIAGGGTSDFVNASAKPAGQVMALDRKTGNVVWERKFGDSVLGEMKVAEGNIIAPVRSGVVAAMDVKDGKVVWETAVNGKSPVMAGVAVADGVVYGVSVDGVMAAIELSSGQVLDKVSLNAPGKPAENGFCFSTPVVHGGKVFVGSETGGLWCFVESK